MSDELGNSFWSDWKEKQLQEQLKKDPWLWQRQKQILEMRPEILPQFLEKMWKEQEQEKAYIKGKLATILPESWRADLEQSRKRWIKRGFSVNKIRYLTIKHLLHMALMYIKIQIDNLSLPKNIREKEIE